MSVPAIAEVYVPEPPTTVHLLRPTLRPTSRGKIIGHNPAMKRVLETIQRVAGSSCTVLVTGESGTGKELVVAALHDASPRTGKPLVTVNCGAIPENLIESELFGHARGAFTGAHATRQGHVAAAEGGTLFLDEVGELPLQVQVKLLRLLQQREYSMVGDSRVIKSDVRIVAATNRDLEAEVAARRFREDLFYRLNVIHIELPALRNRAEDIEPLAKHFLASCVSRTGRFDVVGFTPEALEVLKSHPWPGNVRSLENTVERAVLLTAGPHVGADDLPERMRQGVARPADGAPASGEAPASAPLPETGIDLRAAVERYENQLILQALERTGRNKNRAAQLLGLNRTTLVEMLKRKGL
ncbi:MAG TPA: sigma-54 dependent transcriptional regulator [Polyangiaceae bacterium]|nr:sigma-54 dependent transcriptional regulator [Polyangiaceae bacterium]